MRAIKACIGLALLCALGSCGNKGEPDTQGDTGKNTAPGTEVSWNVTDACSIMPATDIQTILGGKVSSAVLGAVQADPEGVNLYSQCTFTMADGRVLIFGTGKAIGTVTVSEQVRKMRAQAAMTSDVPVVDEPGLGAAALWSPDTHQLMSFLGDGRFISATLGYFKLGGDRPSDEQLKSESIAVLRKAGA